MTPKDLHDTTVLSLLCDALAQARPHDMPPGHGALTSASWALVSCTFLIRKVQPQCIASILLISLYNIRYYHVQMSVEELGPEDEKNEQNKNKYNTAHDNTLLIHPTKQS